MVKFTLSYSSSLPSSEKAAGLTSSDDVKSDCKSGTLLVWAIRDLSESYINKVRGGKLHFL